MATKNEAVTPAKTLLTLAILVAFLSPFFATLYDVSGGGGAEETRLVEDPTVGSLEDVPGELQLTGSTRAEATLGNALFFDGSDSIESSQPTNLTDGEWTICAVAELGEDVNQDGTFTVAAYDNESAILQYDAGNWTVYFDNSTHDGKAEVPALSPTDETAVCGRWNESELSISRDTTVSPGVQLTSSTTSRNVSFDWNGTLDEIRTFNSSVPDSDLITYGNDPIQPLPGNDRETRMMFDEGSGDTTRVFIAGVTESVGGADWTDGVDQPNLDEGTDYELEDEPLRIRVLSGGYLDGAPAVWVVRPQGGPFAVVLDTLTNIGASALVLLAIAVVILAGSKVMGEFDSF